MQKIVLTLGLSMLSPALFANTLALDEQTRHGGFVKLGTGFAIEPVTGGLYPTAMVGVGYVFKNFNIPLNWLVGVDVTYNHNVSSRSNAGVHHHYLSSVVGYVEQLYGITRRFDLTLKVAKLGFAYSSYDAQFAKHSWEREHGKQLGGFFALGAGLGGIYSISHKLSFNISVDADMLLGKKIMFPLSVSSSLLYRF